MTALHPVAANQLVPVDLRIARVAREPRPLGFEIVRIARQVTVVIGHRGAGVVPVEHAVTRDARFGPEAERERGRLRERHGVVGDEERQRLAPHARIAHPPVLIAPCRIVEPVARQRESLLRGGKTRAPHRGRDDADQRQGVLPAETAEEPQSDGQGIGEDALDMHVASRAGIQRQRGAPPPPQMRRGGDLRPREVIAVGQPHRRQKGLQRLPGGKADETDAARTARLAGRRHESGVTDLLRAQQPQDRKITVRQVHAREGDAPGAAFQPAALEATCGRLKSVCSP